MCVSSPSSPATSSQLPVLGCWLPSAICLSKLYREVPPGDEAWNCWAFAVPRFLQNPMTGGLLITLSVRAKKVPHASYVPRVSIVAREEAVPVNPKKGWRVLFDLVKHKSEIRKGK
jgi:hypothetical protein